MHALRVSCRLVLLCSLEVLDPVGGPEIMNRHFVPSVLMLLNWLTPWNQKRTLPTACQTHVDDGEGRRRCARTHALLSTTRGVT